MKNSLMLNNSIKNKLYLWFSWGVLLIWAVFYIVAYKTCYKNDVIMMKEEIIDRNNIARRLAYPEEEIKHMK